MPIKIGINGLGRMGRLGFRAGWDNPAYEIVHLNEIAGDSLTTAHLLEFDSVHGRWHRGLRHKPDAIFVDDSKITHSSEKNPGDVDWANKGIDLVIDCTGKFKTEAALQAYFDQGIKKVLVSAPVSEPAVNIVYGINQHEYDADKHHIVTAASCTTNCLAPVNKQPRSKLTGYCVELPEIIDFIVMFTKSLQAAGNIAPSDSAPQTQQTMIINYFTGSLCSPVQKTH